MFITCRDQGFFGFVLLAIVACSLVSPVAIADERPHAVIVVGTHHYSPQVSMPVFARELERFGFRTTIVMGDGNPEKKTQNILPGIDVLATADVAIFYMRFLKLPDSEWQPIEDYLESGKPVVGLRTTSHSFKYPADHKRFAWNDAFGRRVMGTPYVVHQASETQISIAKGQNDHPIMTGIQKSNWTSPGTLYLTRLEKGCVPLVIGKGTGRARLVEREFGVVQVNESESDIVAWTWQNEWGGNVFATSFGHLGDFAEESFTRMLVNSVCWAADRPVPKPSDPISTWQLKSPNRKPKHSASHSR